MRLPLSSFLESRDGSLAKDAGMKNAVAEVVDGQRLVVKRPGITGASEVVAGGLAQGMVDLNGVVYSVTNDVLWALPVVPASAGGSGGSVFPGMTGWDEENEELPIPIPTETFGFANITLFNGNYYAWDLSLNDTMYISSDLNTWTPVDISANPNKASGASAVFLSRVYVSDHLNGNGDFYYFTNGSDWATAQFSSDITSPDQLIPLSGTLYALYKVAANNFGWSTTGAAWIEFSHNLPASGSRRFRYVSFLNKLWAFPTETTHVSVYSSSDAVTWTLEAADWGLGKRINFDLVVNGDSLYLIGGSNSNGLGISTVVYVTTDGITWTAVDSPSAYPGRLRPVAISSGTSVLSFGGVNVGNESKQIWRLDVSSAPAGIPL